MSKRRTHSPEFKARDAMEAISGRKTLQEIAADHAIHPIQVSQWKKQLLEGSSELFTRGKKSQAKDGARSRKQSCSSRLANSRWSLSGLNKISAAQTPMNDESWSIKTTGSSRLAANVSCLNWPDCPVCPTSSPLADSRQPSWPVHCIVVLVTRLRLLHQCLAQDGGQAGR